MVLNVTTEELLAEPDPIAKVISAALVTAGPGLTGQWRITQVFQSSGQIAEMLNSLVSPNPLIRAAAAELVGEPHHHQIGADRVAQDPLRQLGEGKRAKAIGGGPAGQSPAEQPGVGDGLAVLGEISRDRDVAVGHHAGSRGIECQGEARARLAAGLPVVAAGICRGGAATRRTENCGVKCQCSK